VQDSNLESVVDVLVRDSQTLKRLYYHHNFSVLSEVLQPNEPASILEATSRLLMEERPAQRLWEQRIVDFVGETMPSDDRTARINQTVDTILDHCSQHGSGVLHSCLEGLARNPAWAKDEIELVRQLVEKRINGTGQS
jgi:hypothetical protein